MPKSKNRKGHKQKVASRNVAVKNEGAKAQKAQKEFIMNLIKQEQEKGMFDNTQTGPLMGGPLSGSLMGGPLSGSLMGGPLSFDGDLLTFDEPNLVDKVDETTIQSEIEDKNESE